MSELPKLREGSKWIGSSEIQDQSGDTVRVLSSFIEIEAEEGTLSAYTTDVLALLDANGRNATANELRKELNEACEKLKRVEAVAGCLCELADEFRMRSYTEQAGAETLKLIGFALLDTEQTIRESLK